MVEIYRSRQGDRIAVLTRQSGVNQYVTEASHRRPLHRKIRERFAQEAKPADYRDWLLRQAGDIGPEALQWTRASLASRDFPQQAYRTVRGMLRLAEKHDSDAVEAACGRCLARGWFSAAAVRRQLQRKAVARLAPEAAPGKSVPDHRHVRGAAAFRGENRPRKGARS